MQYLSHLEKIFSHFLNSCLIKDMSAKIVPCKKIDLTCNLIFFFLIFSKNLFSKKVLSNIFAGTCKTSGVQYLIILLYCFSL